MFRLLAFIAFLWIAVPLSAQNAPPHLRGRITDSSGAVIPGSKITILRGSEVIAELVTNFTGDFDLELAAGDYQLEVKTADFNSLRQNVRVAAGMAPLALSLTLARLEQTVEVNETANKAVTIDSDVALTTQTIAGDQLADLPDNEDELVAYLLQLAGTASWPLFFSGRALPITAVTCAVRPALSLSTRTSRPLFSRVVVLAIMKDNQPPSTSSHTMMSKSARSRLRI
jgi:hypothetical protein